MVAKTAEEVLHEQDCTGYCDGAVYGNSYYETPEILLAMEEFAKIRAIDLLRKLRSDVINNHHAQMTNIDLDVWIEKNV